MSSALEHTFPIYFKVQRYRLNHYLLNCDVAASEAIKIKLNQLLDETNYVNTNDQFSSECGWKGFSSERLERVEEKKQMKPFFSY